MRRRVVGASVGISLWLGLVSLPAGADRMDSTNYVINGNTGTSFSGEATSTNYDMFGIGGETVGAGGASTSYVLLSDLSPKPASVMQMTVQPSGLQGYFKLDEGSGTTTADYGPNTYNGTLTGSTWTGSGKIGGALTFSAATDRVETTNPVATGNKLTVGLWAKQSSATTNSAFASTWNSDGNSEGWVLQTGAGSGNVIRVLVSNGTSDAGTNYVESPASSWPTTGAWHYVSFVYDGALAAANRVTIYIDGSAVTGTVTGTIPTTLVNNSTPFVIGNQKGVSHPAAGTIDHVKVFNRALSATEIAAEYGAQNAGSETGLTLGTVTPGASNTALQDVYVRTDSDVYTLLVAQDHNLQNGGNTIPAVSGTITSPAAWSEGTTKGLGFTLITAPGLDSIWNSGANYAAIPTSATSFYTRNGHTTATSTDTINSRLRLDAAVSQGDGAYSNTVTYTGTTIP